MDITRSLYIVTRNAVRTIRARGREVTVVQVGRKKKIKEGDRVPLIVKATKFESTYTPISKNEKERCSSCVNFEDSLRESSTGRCYKVMGAIERGGWCRHYDCVIKLVDDNTDGDEL